MKLGTKMIDTTDLESNKIYTVVEIIDDLVYLQSSDHFEGITEFQLGNTRFEVYNE